MECTAMGNDNEDKRQRDDLCHIWQHTHKRVLCSEQEAHNSGKFCEGALWEKDSSTLNMSLKG